jgi:hypothetical protein
MLAMLVLAHFNKNKTAEDFYVMEETWCWYIGSLSYDGRWFSIGLGRTRFYNGNIRFLMLFTGLFGVWLSAVFDSESLAN